VLDEHNRPRAWPWLRQIKGDEMHAGNDEMVDLDERATLNDALDTMLTSSHGAAVVTGHRGQYLGVVNFTAVTDYMQAQQQALEEATDSTDSMPASSTPQDEHGATATEES
jgi:osmoprotectant transport system ATP-binding protein